MLAEDRKKFLGTIPCGGDDYHVVAEPVAQQHALRLPPEDLTKIAAPGLGHGGDFPHDHTQCEEDGRQ